MDLLKLVEEFEYITIFRHQLADNDAMGAQFGLKEFLKDLYPAKKIYALGDSVGTCAKLYPAIDVVDDEIIKQSLAIVLDTASRDRVDDLRFLSAKYIVKIDHHIVIDEYAHASLVNVEAAATCEILTFLFKEYGKPISKTCATYLYYGISADSLNFTTNNTTSKTLLAGSYLVECGVSPRDVRTQTCSISKKEFQYISEIRNNIQVYGKVAYAIMDEETYLKYGLTYNEAKEKVYVLSDVDEFEIWCLFTQDKEYFNGSLRSRVIPINSVANQYRGGGHKNACGVKQLTLDEIESIVRDLDSCL